MIRTQAFLSIALLAVSAVAYADDVHEGNLPVELSETQLDQVTAGTGRDNVAVHAWEYLFAAGLLPQHNAAADQGVIDKAGHNGVLKPMRP